jgi:ubiquinone/menaquinone biosynthesis C-methylase UbiE
MSTIAFDQHFWDRAAQKYAADPIKDMAGYEKTIARTAALLNRDDRVFEFGCGTGTTALKLAGYVETLEATDISSEMIAIAQDKASRANISNVSFRQATLESPLLEDESYDAVLGFNTLHLLRDLPGSLRHVHRILKPGGLFISKTPCLRDASKLIQWFVPVATYFGKAPYVGMFTAHELRSEVVKADFDINAQEKHGSKSADFRSFIVGRKM